MRLCAVGCLALAAAVALGASGAGAGDKHAGTIVFSVFSGLPPFDGDERCEGLYAVDPDSGRIRRLTAPDARTADGHFFPSFAPGGRSLAFEIWRGERGAPAGTYGVSSEFFALDGTRRTVRRIGRFPTLVVMSPRIAWSSDARDVLVYEVRRGVATLVRVDLRTGRRKQLVRGSIGWFAWVPRERRFSYTLGTRGGSIWTSDREGRARRRLLANAAGPAWSPDGTRLAFFRPVGNLGEGALWVANRDGRRQRRLAARITFGGPRSVAWSPDGRALLFTREARRSTGSYGNFDVYRVGLTGPEQRVKANAIPLGWSPDGSRILFGRPFVAIEAIGVYTAAPDGTRERLVAVTDEEDFNIGSYPVWQPVARPIRAAVGAFAPENGRRDCLERLVRLRNRLR